MILAILVNFYNFKIIMQWFAGAIIYMPGKILFILTKSIWKLLLQWNSNFPLHRMKFVDSLLGLAAAGTF